MRFIVSTSGVSRNRDRMGNGEAAIVEVDAVHAALTSALGQPDVRLQNCARWPLHQSCGQECLVQLDVAPEECLVRGVMMRWYQSKSCAYCGKRFQQVQLLDHKPALISPEGQLVTWRELVGKAADLARQPQAGLLGLLHSALVCSGTP